MPYTKKLNEFNRKSNYVIDSERFVNYVKQVAKNPTVSDAERDRLIKDRVLRDYRDQAKLHERKRQELAMSSHKNPKNKAASDEMLDAENFCKEYFALAATIARVENSKYQPLPLFGLTGDEAANLMRQQMNDYSYLDARKFQMKLYGVKDQRFLDQANELKSMSDNGIKYSTADEYQKDKIYETYHTKELMQQRLDRHGWLWKAFHPGETKAMKAYVQKADELLKGIGFPQNAPTMAKLFANQGYAMSGESKKLAMENTLARAAKNIDEKLSRANTERVQKEESLKAKQDALKKAESDKKKAELKSERDKRAENLKTRMQASQSEVDRVNSKKLEDRFFEVRFRPSFDKTEFYAQYNAFKNVSTSVTGNVFPAGVKSVFKQNYEKFKYMKSFIDDKHTVSASKVEDRQNEILNHFIDKEDILQSNLDKLENYKPLTYEEVENLHTQDLLHKELQGIEKKHPTVVSPKQEDKKLDKNPPAKSNP